MRNLQKFGGLAALYEAAAYIVGMAVFLVVLDWTGVADPGQKVALLAANHTLNYIMNLLIYVVFGVALIVLALALYDRLKDGAAAIMQIATALGILWAGLLIASGMTANIAAEVVFNLYSNDAAQAATVWLAVDPVIQGLGGGTEIVGGLWMLLVSWAAFRSGGLPRTLNVLGAAAGAAGLLSTVPALNLPAAAVFGLSQIAWFVWLGITLLRTSPSAAAEGAVVLRSSPTASAS